MQITTNYARNFIATELRLGKLQWYLQGYNDQQTSSSIKLSVCACKTKCVNNKCKCIRDKLQCADMCRCIDCDNDDMQEKLDEENELILDDED